ncbi:asparagine synthetase B [Sphingomonas sp. HHU CXW]|uniref:asparagine synthase (glutamine-hydrolyzing) n=1 Tax=Sphingomonas hominis TaxID=2741495 RepID=A0ABX2JJH6_9SPHN|nr:asparagine synthase-related protein [Sphingomonas hominis]NTS66785.1 asparagine synthetase B [Sphingomonas hominis]
MTALAGLWDRRGVQGAWEGAVGRMLDAQAIYGPEPAARRTLGEATLGRRLFSLLPEDDFDRGPVSGGDGTLLLVADARIDNRDELAERLGRSMADLARLPEPALVMAVVERWGVAGLGHLVGAFAVILWDERRRALTLARDALGERPLHYHQGDGFLGVASMPKGLHALPEVPYLTSAATSADFLALLPQGGESFFAGIERVLPGHAFTFTADSVTQMRLWTPSDAPLRLSASDYAEGLRAELDRVVASRLRRGDGAVGAHLSGGLDSSSVTASAALALAPDTLHAFTAVPGTPAPVEAGRIGDEGPLAAALAARYPNIAHVLVRGQGASPLPLLDRHFDLYQRPITNPCNAVWWDATNDAARARGVRVLLTGNMGNFTLSHDGSQYLPTLLRHGRLLALAGIARQLHARGWSARRVASTTLSPFLSPRLWEWANARLGRSWALGNYSALRPDAAQAHDIYARASARGLDLSYRPWADGRAMRLWGLERVDMGVFNKGTLGGWGFDLRDPTADRRLIEWALRVPEEQYILNGEPRSLARRAFADRLPAEILHETRRGYQGADWHVGASAALAGLREEIEAVTRCADADALVDAGRLRALAADWPDFAPDDPRWADRAITDRYRYQLLRGVAAGHFLRRVARTN